MRVQLFLNEFTRQKSLTVQYAVPNVGLATQYVDPLKCKAIILGLLTAVVVRI